MIHYIGECTVHCMSLDVIRHECTDSEAHGLQSFNFLFFSIDTKEYKLRHEATDAITALGRRQSLHQLIEILVPTHNRFPNIIETNKDL